MEYRPTAPAGEAQGRRRNGAGRLNTVALHLSLLGASVVAALVIAEVFLRLFPQVLPEEARLRVLLTGFAEEARITIPDPNVGFLMPPFYKGEMSRKDFFFTYTTDQHGFRNPSSSPSEAEIVCVGNSMVFGFGVSDDQAWVRLVAEGLPRSRIVNLGLSGTSPQQYVQIYERFGVALNPKLLIFGLFPGNDLMDARLFDTWHKAGSPGNYNVWRFFGGTGREPVQGWRQLARRSYLLMTLRETVRSLRSPFSSHTIDLADGNRIQLVPMTIASTASGANPADPRFRLAMGAVEEARRRAQEEDTELLVLLFPTKEEVYLPILGEDTPTPIAPFVNEFQQRGIPYLDLTPHFQAVAREGVGLFFEIDGHPNAKGYRLIADVVLKHLRENAKRYDLEDWSDAAAVNR